MSRRDRPRSFRIALVGPAAPWRGGIAQYLDALSATLTRCGHVTHIVSFSRQYPSFLFPGRDQRDPDRSPRPETVLWIDTLCPWTWVRAGLRLRRLRPDAVVFNYWLPLFVPVYAGVIGALDRRHTRVVFDCHNVHPHEKRLLDTVLTGWMLRLPDHFVLHAEATRQSLLSENPGARTSVVPLPLTQDFPDGPGRAEARLRLGIPERHRVLLFFGFVRPYKGLDVALAAMRELPPDTCLVVAGEFYEPVERYAPLLRDLEPGRVLLRDGFIRTEDVGAYFDAADVVVLSHREASQSGVLPLALRFGVPVVASRVGGLVENVQDGVTGYLVPAGDPAALASAILRALDEENAARLREGVLAFRSALSGERLAEAIETVIEETPPRRFSLPRPRTPR